MAPGVDSLLWTTVLYCNCGTKWHYGATARAGSGASTYSISLTRPGLTTAQNCTNLHANHKASSALTPWCSKTQPNTSISLSAVVTQ